MGQEAQRVGRCWDTGRDSGAGLKIGRGRLLAQRGGGQGHTTPRKHMALEGECVCKCVCVCVEPVRWSENV